MLGPQQCGASAAVEQMLTTHGSCLFCVDGPNDVEMLPLQSHFKPRQRRADRRPRLARRVLCSTGRWLALVLP